MKRVYGVCHYIFSGRRVCVRHVSYILSAKSSFLDCHSSFHTPPSWPIITRCYHGRFETYVLCPTHMIVSFQAYPFQPMTTTWSWHPRSNCACGLCGQSSRSHAQLRCTGIAFSFPADLLKLCIATKYNPFLLFLRPAQLCEVQCFQQLSHCAMVPLWAPWQPNSKVHKHCFGNQTGKSFRSSSVLLLNISYFHTIKKLYPKATKRPPPLVT